MRPRFQADQWNRFGLTALLGPAPPAVVIVHNAVAHRRLPYDAVQRPGAPRGSDKHTLVLNRWELVQSYSRKAPFHPQGGEWLVDSGNAQPANSRLP